MSSGPRGEEPINLNDNLRLHYVRLLRLHGCSPRCDRCREAQGILIAAGVRLPERLRDTSDRGTSDRLARTWEPVEIALFVGLLAFALTCVWLTGGRG